MKYKVQSNYLQSISNKFYEIYNSCFPLQKQNIKRGFRSKPWLSNGLLKSIQKKIKLYKSFLRKPTITSETVYKTYKNKLNHTVKTDRLMFKPLSIGYFDLFDRFAPIQMGYNDPHK